MDASLDFTRRFDGITQGNAQELLKLLPCTAGMEFVDEVWISSVASRTAELFNAEFAACGGSAEEFFAGKGVPGIRRAGILSLG